MINKKRLTSLFIELCSIDSEPARERQLADRLKELLIQLEFMVVEDNSGMKIGGNTGNIFARLQGNAPGHPIFFSCHMDRVAPGCEIKARIEGEYIVSDGTTVLGADDAAGIAAIIEAMRVLKEANAPHPTIEVIFTVAEELALLGASHFDLSQLTAENGFILDAGGPVGEIVIQAPEQVKLNAAFHGRKAHAGFAPEHGISAIQMAAAAISSMPLLRVDEETTANIGTLSAVGPTNIVADRCELQAEARSLDPEKLRTQVDAMIHAMNEAASEYGGMVAIEEVRCYQSYRLEEYSAPAQQAARAGQRLGLPVRFKSTGGGSDANIFNNRGKKAVVLSCGYEKVHTTEERIPVQQLWLLAEWVLAIMENGGEQ